MVFPNGRNVSAQSCAITRSLVGNCACSMPRLSNSLFFKSAYVFASALVLKNFRLRFPCSRPSTNHFRSAHLFSFSSNRVLKAGNHCHPLPLFQVFSHMNGVFSMIE